MTDVNQAILISSVAVITVILTIIGIQVAFIFREMRYTVQKINKILDDAGMVSHTMSKSVKELSGFSAGLKSALNVFSMFRSEKKK